VCTYYFFRRTGYFFKVKKTGSPNYIVERGFLVLAIGNDHIGLELKQAIIDLLCEREIKFDDLGCHSNTRVDYPVFAQKVAEGIVEGTYSGGILICGTGVGISIAANKVPGIRAVVCSDPYSALLSKQHNNTNVLALGSRVVGAELAKMIVSSWLDAEFEAGRHQTRLDMISQIESGQSLDTGK